MTRERITFSLLTEDQDIIDHLHKVREDRTISSYIRSLIRMDMNNHPSTGNIDDLADKIARKLVEENMNFTPKQEIPTVTSVSISEKSIIDGLF